MDHIKNSGFLAVASLRETRLATLLFLAILFFLQSFVNVAAGDSPFGYGCYLGAYLGCGVEDSSCPTIETFNDMTGKRHSIFVRYVDMTYAGTQADWDWVTEVKRNGAYPLFMYDPYGGLNALDLEKVEEFAQKCGDFDWPIFVVFGHEMNGMWYPWGQQPELYKETFKQVAEIFHHYASKTRMVWCPNQNWGYPWGGADHGDGYTEYYPQGVGLYGEYVDWVGLVFYEVDWDETDDIPSDFFTVNIINGQDNIDFHNVFAAGKNKPMIICETAAFDSHDDTLCSTPPCTNCPVFSEKQKAFKNSWIDQVYNVGTLKNSFPMLHAICWFHVLKNETIYTRNCGFAVEADYRIPDDHYNVKISDDYFISAHYKVDFDEDGDIDGTDLADFAIQFSAADEDISLLQAFASEFGHIDCACPVFPRIEEYSNSGCLPGPEIISSEDQYPWCGEDQIEVIAEGDTIHVIHKNATYNCCPDDIEVSLSVEGNLIRLTEKEILTHPCTCLCCYDVESTIVDLPSGSYTLEYCWYDYETQITTCDTDEVVIP